MKFSDYQFSPEILSGIEAAGFEKCTPVQDEVFQYALSEGRDVTVQSKTGTGKTAAFLLTIFQRFSEATDKRGKALIVAPTRELAVQIEEEAELLGGNLSFNIASFYGGVGYKKQEQNIKEGVDIIIGTPGRLLDFAEKKKLRFDDVDTLIIDEADRLFDMGFLPDLKKILRRLSDPQERQTMLFSATLGLKVQQLAWDFLYEPKEISISADQITVDEITQELYHVASNEKINLLLGILENEEPEGVLIFTNTKHAAVKLAKRLDINGYHSEFITGDLPQKKRLSIINKIKNKELQVLVATDVAARGLHIDDLQLVVNYDIPEDPENYVHRIGRTARAGKSGKAVTLACERLVFGLEAVEDFIEMKIPVVKADEEMLQSEDRSAGMRISSTPKPVKSKQSPTKKGGGPSKKAGTPANTSGSRNKKKNTQPEEKSEKEKRLEYYRRKYGEDFTYVDR